MTENPQSGGRPPPGAAEPPTAAHPSQPEHPWLHSTGDAPVPPYVERSAPDDAPPGYEIQAELGRGGMGVVYRAVQKNLNRVVALKVVLGGFRPGTREVTRFLVEAEALAAVRHPHVVQVFESGEFGGRPYLAMEFLPGGTLADRLGSDGRLPPAAAAALVGKLASAVQAAHDTGIVHRDLKPGNVLFDAAGGRGVAWGEPKVTDFGLAKRDNGSDLTATGAVMGTPAYMSPEQARGDTKFVGPAADVWALGVILYECLTGTRPFDAGDPLALLARVAAADPEHPRRRTPDVPRDLELICLKCLEKDPADRYPTAAALAEDLHRFAAHEPVSVRAAGMAERAARWARRKPTLAAAYGLGLLAVALTTAAVGAAWLWQRAEKARESAEDARHGEAAAREELARRDYARTVDLAHREFRSGNVGRARELLESCRADFRGWEWRFVHRLCHSDRVTIRGHDDWVAAVGSDPGGRRLLTPGVVAVGFDPSGKRLMTSPATGSVGRVWDAATGRELLSLPAAGRFNRTAGYSRDGTRILSLCDDGVVRVWDAATGRELFALADPPQPVTSAAFSPDGARVATGHNDGSLRVWDGGGWKLLRPKSVSGMVAHRWSPDGSRLSLLTPTGIQAWDTGTCQLVLSLSLDRPDAEGGAFSPDGSRVALTARGNVTLYDANTGSPQKDFNADDDKVAAIAFSPDGTRILTGGYDQTARIWDIQANWVSELYRLVGHTGPVHAVAFSPDGTRVATGSEDGTARVWDPKETQYCQVLNGNESESVGRFALSPVGDQMVTASGEGAVAVRDASTGKVLVALGPDRRVTTAVAYSAGGLVAAAGDDGAARVWDAKTGRLLSTVQAHSGAAQCVSFTPDGARLVTAGIDGAVRLWDAATGAAVRTLLEDKGSPVTEIVSRPDGTRTVTVGRERLRVWDLPSGTLQKDVGNRGQGTQLRFDAQCRRAMTFGWFEATVLWDPDLGKQHQTLRGHTKGVTAGDFSPDGGRVATGSEDRTVKIWDPQNGVELITLLADQGAVYGLAFNPRTDCLLTLGADGKIRLWDPRPVNLEFLPR